jgi:hypothetical protein
MIRTMALLRHAATLMADVGNAPRFATRRSWWLAAAMSLLLAGCGPTRGHVPAQEDTDATTTRTSETSGVESGSDAPSGTTTTTADDARGMTSDDPVEMPCRDQHDCDNESLCDGIETCVDGVCVAGEPIECDDGIACTADACDEYTGRCIHFHDHHRCPDDQICGPNGCEPVPSCVTTQCVGHVYQCGNCIDDDGDGKIDMDDPDCWGPCDNNEANWKPEVPASHHHMPCLKMDCYFDQDGGSGNDDCYWSQTCDPLEPSGCTHDPNTSIPGTTADCAELDAEQSAQCIAYCGPITPNGCDCFGCCEVHVGDDTVTVYIGSEDAAGHGTCSSETADDPTSCNPCTQVQSCLNPCEACELCLGKDVLPDGCDPREQCPAALDPCGLPGQSPCPAGTFCNTGCCQPNPL